MMFPLSVFLSFCGGFVDKQWSLRERELYLSTEISQAHQKLCPLECMVSCKDWIWALCLLLIHPLLSLSVRAAFHLLQLPPDLSTFLNSNDPVSFAEPPPPPCPARPLSSPPIFLCPHCVSCVSVLSWTLFSSLRCLLFPLFSLISPVTSLLSSPALPCSLLSTNVCPWSSSLSIVPACEKWNVFSCLYSYSSLEWTTDRCSTFSIVTSAIWMEITSQPWWLIFYFFVSETFLIMRRISDTVDVHPVLRISSCQ